MLEDRRGLRVYLSREKIGFIGESADRIEIKSCMIICPRLEIRSLRLQSVETVRTERVVLAGCATFVPGILKGENVIFLGEDTRGTKGQSSLSCSPKRILVSRSHDSQVSPLPIFETLREKIESFTRCITLGKFSCSRVRYSSRFALLPQIAENYVSCKKCCPFDRRKSHQSREPARAISNPHYESGSYEASSS